MLRQSRRAFLRDAALGGAGLVVLASSRSAVTYAANDKLNVAIIGAGGRGKSYVDVIPKHANMVAMCDVNQSRAQAPYKEHPDVPKFDDFRDMLDKMDKEVDAVTVATPDHTHAQASVTAMRRGKHVLCEKGLTRTVHEAQLMRKVAAEKKLATQMGNQGTVHAVTSNFSFVFLPTDKFKGVDTGNPKRYQCIAGEFNGHESDWLRACRDGRYTVSDFGNSGPYTEFMLLANVASQIEGAIEYDPIEGKIMNNEQADALLTCERRKGWEL